MSRFVGNGAAGIGRLTGVTALVAVIVVLLAFGGSAQADGPINWSSPERISSVGVESLACPSASFCVGVDDSGTLIWSVHPASSARAWERAGVTDRATGSPVALVDVSCASLALCVATNSGGAVAASADPAAVSPTWTVTHVDEAAVPGERVGLGSIDCPTKSLCVATDATGDVVTSIRPTAGTPAWTVAHVDAGQNYECFHYGETGPSCQPALNAVSCGSPSHCTAVDDAGNVLISDDPAGGPTAWSGATSGAVPASEAISSLACPTASLCVGAAYYEPEIFTGDRGPLNTTAVQPAGSSAAISGVWCASATLCFANAYLDNVADGPGAQGYISRLYATTNPTGNASAWRLSHTLPRGQITDMIASLSCASDHLCFAADTLGNLLVGRSAATPANIKTSVDSALTPRGTGARLASIRNHGRYTTTATAPDAGQFDVKWYLLSATRGTPHHRSAQRLIATGTTFFRQPGRESLSIKLNDAGRSLLSHRPQVRVSALGAFTPTAQSRLLVTRTITLR